MMGLYSEAINIGLVICETKAMALHSNAVRTGYICETKEMRLYAKAVNTEKYHEKQSRWFLSVMQRILTKYPEK